MRRFVIFFIAVLAAVSVNAQKITVNYTNAPATQVFSDVMRQSGKNFIYSSDVLKDLPVSVNVRNQSLKKTLGAMFRNTDISYKVRGNNILLKRKKKDKRDKIVARQLNNPRIPDTDSIKVGILRDVIVTGSKNQTLSMQSSHIGALNISRDIIAKTPALLGESDIIKTLQLEPGVSAGIEGFAGMYVHGGNVDENLYMLDNIPLYQVNHFGGLFSAFNTEAISNVDFYKTTFPSKFDGRMSSFMDVYSRDGSHKKLHGSVRLGLTSGAAHIEGPIWKDRTTFSVAVRRSWFDVLALPICAIRNATGYEEDDDISFGYAFTDINAKIAHKFSDRSKIYAMLYYGEDYLRGDYHTPEKVVEGYYDKNITKLRWGNILASAGWIYDYTPSLWGKLCAAYTRYSSTMSSHDESANLEGGNKIGLTTNDMKSDNNISDWILKGDFEWRTSDANRINFGTSFTFHNFLPSRTRRMLTAEGVVTEINDDNPDYKAREFNVYAEDNLSIGNILNVNFGLHYSIFNITGRSMSGLSPRLAFNITPLGNIAIKGGYSRTVQYVHQLSQSSISLPTDQWVPIINGQKPQTADKIALGVYWKPMNHFTVSVEGYMKWMRNLIDYRDEYYLVPPEYQWDTKLTSGKGTSKGVDFKISKEFGMFSGHIAYSLLWADRQFAERNSGKKYPARFDNRHKINVMLNWKINDKWELGASWTGMSGNRITLPTQCWSDPNLAPWHYNMILKTDINNYRLPFYHRLDLSFTRYTKHGFWTFGLYNAYCNMNIIAVRLGYSDKDYIYYTSSYGDGNVTYHHTSKPVFQKIRLLPTIPSISYTWLF